MLNIFNKKRESPKYRLVPPPSGKLEVLTCHESVCTNRPRTLRYYAEAAPRPKMSDPSSQGLSYET